MNENIKKKTEFEGVYGSKHVLIEYSDDMPPELFSDESVLWVKPTKNDGIIGCIDDDIPWEAFYAFTMAVAEWKKGQS